ncbi:glycine--tRNA ligase subunit beta [Pseudidiomarina tainanensis]|uniref:Glycine--tRNA ligase subunit beta n=1 Tax=Pseudidiomarina tainanensis TaxID=502365 RepID=A0ACD2HHK7_9GAMM|nr:glycine--tRNA ligase subunit beta [Pseudidiomarina tainanensis]RZQ55854.1 glycine--tRNA ligase subunit beta [Pseudidiomarina tainanensis]
MRYETLLVEIGTEELPPKALKGLSDSFTENLSNLLKENDFTFAKVKSYASPRRLAVQVFELASQQADKVVEKRGPAVNVAFDDAGNPTKAAEGWARGNGITVAEAERLVTDKGEWLLYKAEVQGQPLAEVLPELVATALKKLPIPKPMRWGSGSAQFIRPVKTITMLYGAELVPGTILDVSSNTHIQGHRFHAPQGTTLKHADDYEAALESVWVVGDFAKRREIIVTGINKLANELGGHVVEDTDLIDEVTALVEWPVALSASFDKAFLSVPKEPLIVTMKDDQRYFPLEDEQGQLLPAFIFITNIESKDPAQIISGNEKVVRPRLADAQFFFEADKKVKLADRVDGLANILFQKQLGSIKDKSDRIAAVAGDIADDLAANGTVAERAGYLCKADLAAQMVLEFPETQGVMGMHYARHDGEAEGVPQAIYEHYLPRFAGDDLPQSPEGAAVAIADKLDTLVGIFGIGQTPKGDRDPFALRRAAIGLLRIIVEGNYPLDLEALVAKSRQSFGKLLTADNVQDDVVDFLLGRFRTWYQEQGIAVDVIQAVLARRPTKPVDFDLRVKAVTEFRNLAAADALAAANKRVSNILAKVEGELPSDVNASLLTEDAERALANAINSAKKASAAALQAGNYTEALSSLASLQEPVDAFFDNVMVNADDDAVRQNRLALLQNLRELFLQIADISVLN